MKTAASLPLSSTQAISTIIKSDDGAHLASSLDHQAITQLALERGLVELLPLEALARFQLGEQLEQPRREPCGLERQRRIHPWHIRPWHIRPYGNHCGNHHSVILEHNKRCRLVLQCSRLVLDRRRLVLERRWSMRLHSGSGNHSGCGESVDHSD